jgi:hypothetical protein
MLTIVSGLLITAGTVLAVHDETFQLDGNTTPVVGVGAEEEAIPDPAVQTLDWNSLFTSSGANEAGVFDPDADPGFTSGDLVEDFSVKPTRNGNASTCVLDGPGNFFCSVDASTFATGSKDILDIPDWQCNKDNNVNSKIDIMNAYAASYVAPDGDKLMYFGLDKNKDNGNNNVAFWFLKDKDVSCASPGGGAVDFSGEHRDGDVLVVSAFTNGGGVSNIDAYRWDGDDACIDNPDLGTPDPAADCDGEPVSSGGDCKDAPTEDDICATTNSGPKEDNDNITTKWRTSDATLGVGHTVVVTDFFEGGINLTNVLEGDTCFNTFLADTRSSQELTATLFDFARGQLGGCTSDTETTPSTTEEDIPVDPADAIVTVHDSADITVTGIDTFAGTVTFFICGPFEADADDLCDTGGVELNTEDVTANGTFLSDDVDLTAAGRYCFRADFSGDEDAGVPPSSDSAETECLVINPAQPTLDTDAGEEGPDDPPVAFGQPVTDTASLVGTAHKPGTDGDGDGSINPSADGGDAGGTITFTLYKADCETLATGTGDNPQTASVTGDGSYGPVSFTPDEPGIYHWVASYDGDPPNTLSDDHNTACDDSDETVTIQQIPTSVKTQQSWIPNDTATVTAAEGNLGADGEVLFELFANADCSGDPVYEETVDITGGTPFEEVGTSNVGGANGYEITTDYDDPADSTVGLHSWQVTYTPNANDTAHLGSSSTCSAEHFDITYTNDPGPQPTPTPTPTP